MVIGNGGGGKTTLARELAAAHGLPLFHVDSFQFRPGWERTPVEECDRILDGFAAQREWVIDGFGSRPCIERRMEAADTIVFVDFRLAVHYWWALKRQFASGRRPRSELPPGCPESSVRHTCWLFRIMWRVHREFRPWFLARLGRKSGAHVHRIRSPGEWRRFLREHAVDS